MWSSQNYHNKSIKLPITIQISHLEISYETIGGSGPTGADIGGNGANCGDEIGADDWMVDCDNTPDTDDDEAIKKNCCIFNRVQIFVYDIAFE